MKLLIKVTQEVLDNSRNCLTMPLFKSQLPKFGLGYQLEILHHNIVAARAGCNLARNCMVSQAVQDIFPIAITSSTHIYPGGEVCENEPSIELPIPVQRRIREFDHMKTEDRKFLKPFSFEVEVPDEVIEKISIKRVHEILSSSKTLELVED